MKVNSTVYPKTKRLSLTSPKSTFTEKLDGSNLAFARVGTELYICQRNWIFKLSEIDEYKGALYKGLYGWLGEHSEQLLEEIYDGSVLCGEWIGMGKIKYADDVLDKRYYMYAKARFNEEDYSIENISWRRDLLKCCFNSQTIPDFIGLVPVVAVIDGYPTVEDCDAIYAAYTNKVNRAVEGFVIEHAGEIRKYVRMKGGKLGPHTDRGGE